MEPVKPCIQKPKLAMAAAILLILGGFANLLGVVYAAYGENQPVPAITGVLLLVCAALIFAVGKKSLLFPAIAAAASMLTLGAVNLWKAWDTAVFIEYLLDLNALIFLLPGILYLAIATLFILSAFKPGVRMAVAILCFVLAAVSAFNTIRELAYIIAMNSGLRYMFSLIPPWYFIRLLLAFCANLGLALFALSCREAPQKRAGSVSFAGENSIENNNFHKGDIPIMNDQNSPLLQEKSIALCIILSFVTCAIYYIVWMLGICKKIKLIAGEEPRCGGELACILLVPFYLLYWLYTRSKKLAQAGVNCGIQLEDRSVINLLLAIFGFSIVSVALIQSDLNKAARAFAGTAA